jgi:asparagine synthase (glutamine-hydrolysing)
VCLDFLPAEVVRRKKRGFAVNVVDEWFQRSLSASMDATLSDEDSLMYRYLESPAVKQLLADHRAGVADNHKVLFSLVVLEQWLRLNDSSRVMTIH